MPLDEGDAPPSLAASAASVGVCACCFVWEVTRGPHAGERVAFDALETPQATLGVGRKSTCWLRLRKDLEVSGLHAELKVTLKQPDVNGSLILSLALSDANSTNGTRVNGQLLASGESLAVHDRDLVQFGRTTARMRMGNTQCSRAQKDEKESLAIPNEPEDEPVVASALALPMEETNKEVPVRLVGKADEHSDENACKEPVRTTTANSLVFSPSSALLGVCMVCGQALAAWSMLEQQLHVNACLDKRTNTNRLPTKPPKPTKPTNPTKPTKPTKPKPPTKLTKPTKPTNPNANAKSKKRKRQTKLLQDEEMAVALALSESLVDKEQQVDTEVALVSGELAQLDVQLKKMQKKRVALVKKLEKLEKTKKKVRKSQVVGPEETQLRLDTEKALRVLFPSAREAQGTREVSGRTTKRRPAVVRLLKRYRPMEEEETGEMYVTMWRRCMQLGGGGGGGEEEEEKEKEDDQLYVNRLLRRLRAREDESSKRTAEEKADVVKAEDAEMMEEEVVAEEQVDTDENNAVEKTQADAAAGSVPDVVKRVFPDWKENLAFLATQSLPDLRDALAQMQTMVVKRQQRQDESAAVGKERSTGDGRSSKDDEALACAFFEHEMRRLMAEREREAACQDVEIVVLVDSQADEDNDVDMAHREDDYVCPQREDKSPSILSIDDSSEEEQESAVDDVSARTAEQQEIMPMEVDAMEKLGRASMEEVVVEDVACKAADTSAEATTRPLPYERVVTAEDSTPRTQPVVAIEESSDTRLERQLLTALKANATLYESVLLLRPLDLQQLLQYVRDDAGIKCPKTALVKFCDRHGITFKSS